MAMFDSTSHAKKCQGKPVLMLVPVKKKIQPAFKCMIRLTIAWIPISLKIFINNPYCARHRVITN